MTATTDIPAIGSNLESFSVTLEVPNLDPTQLDGGTGSISFNTRDLPRPQLLRNTRVTLSDDQEGTFIGRISEVGWSEEGSSFTAETMLNRLKVSTTFRPEFAGISTGVDSVLSLVGMVSEGLPSTSVTFPGWQGTILDYLKMFCAVFDYEFVPHETNPDVVVFRPLRGNSFTDYSSGVSFRINDQTLARKIEVVDYSYEDMDNNSDVEFSPAYTSDVQILTVDAGQVATYDIKVNGWVSTLNQPVVMDLVGPEERTDVGAYCVSGSDGLPITATQWTDTGGSVTVETTDDPTVIHVTVVAPKALSLFDAGGEERFAPYSIAATAGDNTVYNSLHITGRGVRYREENIAFFTGVDDPAITEDTGAVVENPWVTGTEKTFRVGVRAAQVYAGPNYTVDLSGAPRTKILDVVGSRCNGDAVKFRVVSVTGTESSLSGSGYMDTTFADFNAVSSGMTFSQWNNANVNMTFNSWAAVPLKVS